MASSSRAMDLDPPADSALVSHTTEPAEKDVINFQELKTNVYNHCVEVCNEEGWKSVFTQASLLETGIVPGNNAEELQKAINSLLDYKYMKQVISESGLGFRIRNEEEAKKFRTITTEQEMVYSFVDEAEAEGIWTKTIKIKSKLHESVITSCLKALEVKGMIAKMKSVENPHRVMYIKSHLRPSDRATGGSWYTEGELDEGFIEQICDIVYGQIKQKSFYFSSSAYKKSGKSSKHMTDKEAIIARDQVLSAKGQKVVDPGDERAARSRKYEAYFPMPADYTGYPGVDELTAFIHNAGISSQILVASEIQQLLDVMCFDGRIERVIVGSEEGSSGGIGYKATRRTLRHEYELGSTLMGAPCGRCPVFDICEEGGPVAPSSCLYLKEWLDF
ncbi:putative DNA-directed RNA polymerase III subunit rpc6 [Amylocarpus encephaloides]|uniref:DNA-directed RNA polymerase III subunit RPC6 n=1 Tax=Amylocarpus encephaloides TaxID=45428 RepID=A0A9P8C768_9HELO|nr:putative DNA-directed RNA polymerase III subunit rpc6 [Amylocarpus encephaloides]